MAKTLHEIAKGFTLWTTLSHGFEQTSLELKVVTAGLAGIFDQPSDAHRKRVRL
jgi:hypothetical protein